MKNENGRRRGVAASAALAAKMALACVGESGQHRGVKNEMALAAWRASISA